MMSFVALTMWPLVIVAVLASLAIVTCLEHENEGWAGGSAIVGTALILWLYRTNPWPWIHQHLGAATLALLGYFVVGTVWSFVKWYLFLLNIRDHWREHGRPSALPAWKRADSMYDAHGDPIPPPPGELELLPSARQHKKRIVGWMTYWPWSVPWTLLNDPLRRAWNHVYRMVNTLFDRISVRVFREFK